MLKKLFIISCRFIIMLDKNKHTKSKTKQNKIISDFLSVQGSMKTCFQVTNTLSGGSWKVR